MKVFIWQIILACFFLDASCREVVGVPFDLATINIRVATKKDSANYWDYRKEIMIDFIRNRNLSVICMQEVSSSQMNYLTSVLTEYEYVGNNPKIVKGEEYLPIFYSRKDFSCLGYGTFGLSETPEITGSIGWDSKNPRRVTWVTLMNLHNKKFFCVVNTHLDHVGKDARLNGMKLIKKRMKKIAEEMPVIICGDMNCSATSLPYYSALNDDFVMYNAYQIAKQRKGVIYTHHAFGEIQPVERRNMIDYIFVTNQIEVDDIDIPQEKKINGAYLTDHCPVIASIKIQ